MTPAFVKALRASMRLQAQLLDVADLPTMSEANVRATLQIMRQQHKDIGNYLDELAAQVRVTSRKPDRT